ncbi:ribosome-recycling factor, chloroplastic [Cicer arietinum]|uniref:Ribosome-recycling factor, chloroplastic n=1 Tax=Cicer arietinum TaxID=3827 RepID=A0A1S2XVK8_CICAR|nr:ribosome-recycling factor, chloroplastic [Cicer arietinum]
MATSFSPTPTLRSIFQNPPKPFLLNRYSFTSASSYVTLNLPRRFTLSGTLTGRPLLSKGFFTLHKRKGIVRAATIEEIEAEKASIENDVKNRMERTLENVRTNFSSIRTGRANPSMLDKIEVEYYGSPVSLKSIAQISTPDASSLLIQPYDKSSLKAIEKAIVASNLGMTPNNDGDLIRLNIPQLTSDRRKELTKIVSKQVEEGKVALRNIRRDALKAYEKLEKEKKLSEDNVKDLSSDLQKLTDDYIKKVDAIYKQKEKELLTV